MLLLRGVDFSLRTDFSRCIRAKLGPGVLPFCWPAPMARAQSEPRPSGSDPSEARTN